MGRKSVMDRKTIVTIVVVAVVLEVLGVGCAGHALVLVVVVLVLVVVLILLELLNMPKLLNSYRVHHGGTGDMVIPFGRMSHAFLTLVQTGTFLRIFADHHA